MNKYRTNKRMNSPEAPLIYLLKIRYVREMNVRKLNSVLVIREIARQAGKVL